MSIRIGFIGSGGIAAYHLSHLVRIPEAEIVGLCDVNPAQIEKTRETVRKSVEEYFKAGSAKELNAKAYTDYRAMLQNEDLDAVYICLPPYAHGEIEREVIERGLPFYIEKPVAKDMAIALRIRDAVKERGLLTSVGYQMRYWSAMKKAKELLQNKTIGMALVMRWATLPPVPWYPYQSRSGGMLIEMVTHHVDQLRYLLGEVDMVYGAGARRVLHKVNPEYDVFDVSCATLTFESGIVASIANNLFSGKVAPKTATGVHILAEDLTLSFQLGQGLTIITPDKTETYPYEDYGFAADQMFVTAVRNGDPSYIQSDYADACQTLAITLAIEESERSGSPVKIDEFMRLRAL